MRCNEIKNRLKRQSRFDDFCLDKEIMEHIKTCPVCAREYKAELSFQNLIKENVSQYTEEITPLHFQKIKVNHKLNQKYSSKSIRRSLWGIVFKQPRFNIVSAIAVAGLITIMFLPSYQNGTITRYNLSFEGIAKELALDDDIICDLLFNLGLIEAGVDVGECEVTCNLLIFDLKDQQEVQMVMAAFKDLNPDIKKTEVIQVIENKEKSSIEKTI